MLPVCKLHVRPKCDIYLCSYYVCRYHNFLSEAEARHVAGMAATSMKRSSVVSPNGSAVFSDYRTSFGTFLLR